MAECCYHEEPLWIDEQRHAEQARRGLSPMSEAEADFYADFERAERFDVWLPTWRGIQ
jgi:hypothetical protein